MKRAIIICILCSVLFLVSCDIYKFSSYMSKDELNMSNTVSPLLSKMAEEACQYENVQMNVSIAKGGRLIYKREPIDTCISGIGNVYYIRCYDWAYNEQGRLWYRPTKDVSTETYSCIKESKVNIPYWDKKLQYAKIGEKYFVHKKLEDK